MPNEISLDYSNMLKKLNEMAISIRKIEPKATKDGAEIAQKAIENELPRSNLKKYPSGYKHLKDNVFVSGMKTSKETGNRFREVNGGNLGYKWSFLEWGTVKMDANKFLTRAKLSCKDEIQAKFIEYILKSMDKGV